MLCQLSILLSSGVQELCVPMQENYQKVALFIEEKQLYYSVQSIVSNSLQPHGLQYARLPCPSPTPRACSNSCPSSRWCHPTISSSVVPSSTSFNLSQHQGLIRSLIFHQGLKTLNPLGAFDSLKQATVLTDGKCWLHVVKVSLQPSLLSSPC